MRIRVWQALRRFGALSGACIALGVQAFCNVAVAEPLVLDAANLSRLAVVMIERGQPDKALGMADALLRDHPENSGILALKSRALRDLGRADDAIISARMAWRAAESPDDKYRAAMIMAQALASDGSKFSAQFWLRRAMQFAPNEAAKRRAERDFGYVRNRSRLWVRFDASVRPSDNVNNGSSADTLWFYGFPMPLSGDAQALSGVQSDLALTTRYRLGEGETHKTDLRFSFLTSLVALSGEAKRQAPDARGSDYTYSAIETALEHSWRPALGVEAFASGTLGHSWYGGDPLAQYARLDLGATKAVSPRLSFKGSLSVERQFRQDNDINTATISTIGVGIIARTAAKDRLGFSVSYRDTHSDSAELDGDRIRLQLDWDRAKPVLGAKLGLDLWAEKRDNDRSRYITGGRSADAFGAELSLVFDKVDYMGFVPVMTLSGSTANSNVDLFDTETLGVGFSIQSKF